MAAIAFFYVAEAASADPTVDNYDAGGIQVRDSTAATAPQPGGSGPAQPDRPVYAYWAMVFTPEGFCRERRFTTDPAEADAYNYVYGLRVAEANQIAQLDHCPDDATPAPAPPTPGDLAREFWDVRRLPQPTLKVVPDDAIVGKRVYLEILGPASTTFDVPNPIGTDIAIEATSRYLVDWGDGSPPVTTTSRGGPWPHGDVTHSYDNAHPGVVIRVTQLWSAQWRAGSGAAGTLDNLQTAGELTVRVDQLQPVRNR